MAIRTQTTPGNALNCVGSYEIPFVLVLNYLWKLDRECTAVLEVHRG